jgi:PAS domain S-box-containing protein
MTSDDFLAGGGAMGALIRDHDWVTTPLGPVETWPGPLRAATGIMLRALPPMAVYWGSDLVLLYNDGWRALIGGKHPAALGRPAREVFPEIWNNLLPTFEGVMSGQGGTQARGRLLPIDRSGRVEDAWFDCSFNPIPLGDGTVGGVLNLATEITAQVEAEQARRAGEAQQAFLLALGDRTRDLIGPREVMATAAGLLGNHLAADRAGYAEVDARGEIFVVERDWCAPDVASLAGQHRIRDFGSAAMAELRAGRTLVFEDTLTEPAIRGTEAAETYRSAGIRAAIAVPLIKEGRMAAALYLHWRRPQPTVIGHVELVQEVAERTWATVERARAEAALRESEERLRLIVENARDYAIFTTDAEGRIESWWPGAQAVFGWPAAEAIGKPASLVFTPEDRDAGVPDWELATARAEGAAPDVRWHLRHDGSHVFIEGSTTALRRPDGTVRGFLKIGHDVTTRRAAEDGNARLAAIVTSTTDAIISFAAEDGRILSWNHGAEALFGYTEAEALGGPVGLLVPADRPDNGDPTGVFRRALAGQRVHEYETIRRTKSGEHIPVSVTAARMLASDGRVIGVSGIFRDMRQRKAADERQALLAREVDHRAKNALAVVLAALRLTPKDDAHAYAAAVEGRIGALARAQTLLARERWHGAALHALLQGEMTPFLAGQQVKLDGPATMLPAGAAQPLAMAVHELATNAAKYGALSVLEGRVSVSWRLDVDAAASVLRLRWAEAGGPPVTGPPTRRGFGSRVLDGTLRSQLGGKVSLTWKRTGLVCEMEVPILHHAASAGALSAGTINAD